MREDACARTQRPPLGIWFPPGGCLGFKIPSHLLAKHFVFNVGCLQNLPMLHLLTVLTFSVASPALQTWWHDRSEPQLYQEVAPAAVRRSAFFGVNVTLVGSVGQAERSFVYMSVPRSAAPKRGYSNDDGAEYAAGE
jgi:hypothetical protein